MGCRKISHTPYPTYTLYPMNTTLTAIAGLTVGHSTDPVGKTGCTVVLCPPEGCIASGSALGAAPGVREVSLLEPSKTVEKIHAIVLAGGSAFGLDAVGGVMRWLEQNDRGLSTPFGKVPIVPAGVIYDLSQGDSKARPDAEAGYFAASCAGSASVEMGLVGAAVGSSTGKYLGYEYAAKGGLGSAAINVGGATVAALAVCNAFGDIFDLQGQLVAGATKRVSDLANALIPQSSVDANDTSVYGATNSAGTNTTLVVVATDAPLTKTQAHALAQSAHIGIARVTRPSHTLYDGDTTFVLSTGEGPTIPLLALSVAVQEVVAEAIMLGVRLGNA
jgi:L-aminopeptidase/D-esterase-like protein